MKNGDKLCRACDLGVFLCCDTVHFWSKLSGETCFGDMWIGKCCLGDVVDRHVVWGHWVSRHVVWGHLVWDKSFGTCSERLSVSRVCLRHEHVCFETCVRGVCTCLFGHVGFGYFVFDLFVFDSLVLDLFVFCHVVSFFGHVCFFWSCPFFFLAILVFYGHVFAMLCFLGPFFFGLKKEYKSSREVSTCCKQESRVPAKKLRKLLPCRKPMSKEQNKMAEKLKCSVFLLRFCETSHFHGSQGMEHRRGAERVVAGDSWAKTTCSPLATRQQSSSGARFTGLTTPPSEPNPQRAPPRRVRFRCIATEASSAHCLL